MEDVFSLTNPTFRYFLGYATVVITKTLFIGAATGNRRVANKAYITEEDAKSAIGGSPDGKVKSTPLIDRLRRIHQNDIENVVPFVLIGLLYTAIQPDTGTALLHFRVFTVSRLLHTVVYFFAVPQPARALLWGAGMLSTFSMIYSVFTRAAF